MVPYLRECYGNPNSIHSVGQECRKAVEEARAEVAALIDAEPDEIVFTSCGSEADCLAIYGAAQRAWNRSNGQVKRIITSPVEHEAVRGATRQLAARGFEVKIAPVDGVCRVSAEGVAELIDESTALVSVMYANNELGTLQPVKEIAEICREKGVTSHTDAVQAGGKVPISVRDLGVDLLALSGHKINAPKGIAALYIRRSVVLAPMITGHQERNRRGGTENVASIVGLGEAARLARLELSEHAEKTAALRDRLESGALKIDGVRRTLDHAGLDLPERLPGTAHLCCEGVDGNDLVISLDLEGICVSSGPACSGGATELSHVLKAIGVPETLGRGALRVSLGWGSTEADIDRFLGVLPDVLEKLRKA